MSDYISREAIMQKFADHVRRSNNSDFAPTPTWNEAVDIVEHFSAADVVERKHGEWKRAQEQPYFRKHFDIVVCSSCHNRGNKKWNFCPNCAADMRGET